MKTLLVWVLLTSATLIGSSGCGCTLQANWSVLVEVVDASGAFIADATVTYCVDGGIEKPCDLLGSRYRCGVEQDGDFTITARKGMLSKTVEIEVEEDICHVESQSLTIKLGG